MKTASKILIFLSLAMVALFAAACSLPFAPAAEPTPAFGPFFTAQAQTMVAQMTQIANLETAIPPDVQQPTGAVIVATEMPTWTPLPTYTPYPTLVPPEPPTAVPTAVPTAIPTAAPTAVPTRIPTAVIAIPCNLVKFVADVSVPDNSTFAPNTPFTKIWRLQNAGSCNWTTDYSIVYFSGDKMEGNTATALSKTVKPGETIDIALKFKAPGAKGSYLGNWVMRTKDGVLFGLNAAGTKPFWVKIAVQEVRNQGYYNLAGRFCDATWTTNQQITLPCPGRETDKAGSVQLTFAPKYETGAVDDEATLWIVPPQVDEGEIHGTYPAFTIQNGDKFQAVIGCMSGDSKCMARFILRYKNNAGELINLGSWQETYDQNITAVEVDLSPLAGQTISLILVVDAQESFKGDSLFWLNPRVVRP